MVAGVGNNIKPTADFLGLFCDFLEGAGSFVSLFNALLNAAYAALNKLIGLLCCLLGLGCKVLYLGCYYCKALACLSCSCCLNR